MDSRHAAFATTDAVFYDRPGRRASDHSREFHPDLALAWSSWRTIAEDHWMHWQPQECWLPDQGWKVHVSTTAQYADTVLQCVSGYCHARSLAFKHLRSEALLHAVLGKDADRSSAGKFITIYPPPELLHDCLNELDWMVGGLPGPYVLSDLRWRRGPLYLRYGAFVHASVMHEGKAVPAIEDLRTGRLVPDLRIPSFVVPPWVNPPSFIQGQMDQLDSSPPAGLPTVTEALHHSNAGGIYGAELHGQRIVLKEARPHAGWSPDGRDAVKRLLDEEETLRSLPPGVSAPRVLGTFEAHGHRFLALERMEGESLAAMVVARSPLASGTVAASDFAQYRDWALDVAEAIRRQVQALHDGGIAHCDLHPRNVLISPQGDVALIDYEMALPKDSSDRAALGVAGFLAPDERGPEDRDWYALACLELFMFLPLTPLLALDESKAEQLLLAAQQLFGLTDEWVERRREVLEPRSGLEPARVPGPSKDGGIDDSPVSLCSIARGLVHDGDASRADRLWPGDPEQYSEAKYSLGYGALGVASALSLAEVDLPADQIHWITEALEERSEHRLLGLMNGIAGAVWGCHDLGMSRVAEQLLAELGRSDWHDLDSSLYSGVPGVALTLLANAHADSRRADAAAIMSQELRERLALRPAPERVGTDRGGLFGGASGTALLALRLFEWFDDASFLELARCAIDHDIESLAEANDGSLHVDEGWRLMPYLGYGSAGIGLVLAQYLTYAPHDQRRRHVLERIVDASCAPFTVQSGLLHGRAGLIYFLSMIQQLGFGSEQTASALSAHAEALSLHALRHEGGVRFTGNGLLRASCDLASGAAGGARRDVRAKSGRAAASAETEHPAFPGTIFLALVLMCGRPRCCTKD